MGIHCGQRAIWRAEKWVATASACTKTIITLLLPATALNLHVVSKRVKVRGGPTRLSGRSMFKQAFGGGIESLQVKIRIEAQRSGCSRLTDPIFGSPPVAGYKYPAQGASAAAYDNRRKWTLNTLDSGGFNTAFYQICVGQIQRFAWKIGARAHSPPLLLKLQKMLEAA